MSATRRDMSRGGVSAPPPRREFQKAFATFDKKNYPCADPKKKGSKLGTRMPRRLFSPFLRWVRGDSMIRLCYPREKKNFFWEKCSSPCFERPDRSCFFAKGGVVFFWRRAVWNLEDGGRSSKRRFFFFLYRSRLPNPSHMNSDSPLQGGGSAG